MPDVSLCILYRDTEEEAVAAIREFSERVLKERGQRTEAQKLMDEAEEEMHKADPLMAGHGDGKQETWTDGKLVGRPELERTLEERGARYGKFIDNATVSQLMKDAFRGGVRYHALELDQLEALDQIASKVSRIVTGDSNYADNWVDIAGFATLVANRLREEQ